MRRARIAAFAVGASAIALYLPIAKPGRVSAPLSSSAQQAQNQLPCSEEDPVLPASPTPLDVIKMLIHKDENGISTPLWEHWCTKADIGLEPPHPEKKGQDEKANLLWDQQLAKYADLRALRSLPRRQSFDKENIVGPEPDVGLRLNSVQTTSSTTQTDRFRVTSPVLFNSKAANALRAAVLSDARLTHPVELPTGSMIVKTIWQIRLFAAAERVSSIRTTVYQQSSDETSGKPILDSGTNVSLTIPDGSVNTTGQGCTATKLDGGTTLNAPGCFYSFSLLQDTPSSIRSHFQDSANLADNVKGCMSYNCLVVLTGFHVMIKTQVNGWQFMTFWLTQNDQQNGLGGTWKFFSSNATQQKLDDSTTPHSRASAPRPPYDICFNPYLETGRPNGNVSNCVRCHQLARYYNKPVSFNELSIFFTLGSATLGLPSFDQDLEDPNVINQEMSYMNTADTVSADFLWSLVTYQLSLAQTPPAVNRPNFHATVPKSKPGR